MAKKVLGFISLLALVGLAAACNRAAAPAHTQNDAPAAAVHTDITTVNAPEQNKDLLLFESNPEAAYPGSKTNIFITQTNGTKPFLPDGYYLVPFSGQADLKAATLQDNLLVQKDASLYLYRTNDGSFQMITGITVPSWANIKPLLSSTGGHTILLALLEKDSISKTPHATLLYSFDFTTGMAVAITNPTKDVHNAQVSGSPLGNAYYDAQNNRLLARDLTQGLSSALNVYNLSNGQHSVITLDDSTTISEYGQYLTVQKFGVPISELKIIDLTDQSLTPKTYALTNLDASDSTSPFKYYTYIGNNRMIERRNTTESTYDIVILQQSGNSFSPFNTISFPNFADIKGDNNTLYFVYNIAVGSDVYRVTTYDVAHNAFTAQFNTPKNATTSNIEYIK